MYTRRRDKDCFRNAFCAMGAVKDLTGELPLYVEGVAGRFEVHHGWLMTADPSAVVDVTPAWLDNADARVRALQVEYRPLLVLTIHEVLDHVNKRGATLPVLTDVEFRERAQELVDLAEELEG